MIILPCLILMSSTLIKCQRMSFIGDAIELHSPCSNRILTMERIIGGPPSKENYWDGTFEVQDVYPNLKEAKFTLRLSEPANVTSVGFFASRVTEDSEGFHLSYSKPFFFGYKKLQFRVEGRPFGKFPEVEYLSLNGADVCSND